MTVTGKIYTKVTANTGLIGSSYASTIENVQFGLENDESMVKSDTNGYSVGGIVGAVYTATTINNSKNYGEISNGANVAGIIGYIGSGIQVNIKDCYNYGIVSSIKGVMIGGIVGRNLGNINIKNSGNEGNIIANVDNSGLAMGGIIGRNYADATIDDSYNSGEIINETQIYDTSVATSFSLALGGIIGCNTNQGKIVKINNTYNLGNVTGGMRMGGIIGYNTGTSEAILNKVFNRGNITNIDQMWSGGFNIGGLVGYNNNGSELYILNSYNTYVTNSETEGNVSGNKNAAGGIVGASNQIGVIINCYNKGNITKTNGYSNGIMNYAGTTYINNVYNIGNINGSIGSYGIGLYTKIDPEEYTITNSYYLNNVDIGSTIDGIEVGEQLTEKQMNGNEQIGGQKFVDILNSNIASAETEMKEKFPILEDYTLSKWMLGNDGYPILNN